MPPKKPGEKKNTKKPLAHPPYREMIAAAITALKERSGSSRQAILKYIKANYNLTNPENQLKFALKRGVVTGRLTHVRGTGASGSFRLARPVPLRKRAAAKRTTTAEEKRKAKPAARITSAKTSKLPSKKKSGSTPQKKKTAARRSKPATPKKRSPAKKRVVKTVGSKKGKK